MQVMDFMNTAHDIIIPIILQSSTFIWGDRNSIKIRFAQWHTPMKFIYFNINYTPQRTPRAWYYLFQFDLASTSESNKNPKEQGIQYCMFLAKHPDNQVKSNEFSRWWPEWYTCMVYIQCILIRPNACPYRKKYIQWATELKLTLIPDINEEEHCYLVGPFNFESIDKYY